MGYEELVVYVFGMGRCGWRGDERMGFANPVVTGGVLDVCLQGLQNLIGRWLPSGYSDLVAQHCKYI